METLMSVIVTCACSNSFALKDEFAGSLVKCPACGSAVRAGVPRYTSESAAHPVFGRDIFLLRQKALRISEKYDVCDDSGQPIAFVERPAHLLRNLLAMLIGTAAAVAWVLLVVEASSAIGGEKGVAILAPLGFIGFIPVFAVVATALSKKRHVTFYTGQDKRDRLLEVLQDQKLHLLNATYTLSDVRGTVLARFRKNYLFNLIRRRWEVLSPDGRVLWVAKEDSIILSLLRRFLGPMFGLLRTNFVIQPSGSERVIGEFKRKFTILDRYALDLTPDVRRDFDRRVALALGVMLDTGERR
jgi:uncharacterized protein YxjI